MLSGKVLFSTAFPCFIISPFNSRFIWQFIRGYSCRQVSQENINSKWESVVGLEIHAQINAKSKLFSGASTNYGAPTNTEVSYFDAAMPGTLPVLNRYCVEAGVLTALALNCTVNKHSTFDRKHYFYPDLPAGYQITQQFHPLASNGHIQFIVQDSPSYECTSKLKQIQLEQDSGKSFHVQNKKTFIDLNRAGIGLMELVFEPDLKNGKEAAALVKELMIILRRLNTCTCEMEEGALRVDANISVNQAGESFGVRTEVKNINSLRYIAQAIDFEISRQIKVMEDGGFVANETRAFDYSSKKTVFMRDKETLQDYRFMPEPNLPPIRIVNYCDDSENDDTIISISKIYNQLPPLPAAERTKLISEYDVPYDIADKLVSIEGLREIFETVALTVKDRMYISNFLLNNVQHQLNVRKLKFKNCPVTGKQIAEVVELATSNVISDATTIDILEMLFNGDQRSAKEIVERYNWYLIWKEEELEKLCKEVMIERPKMVKKYRNSRKRRYMTSLLTGLNEKVNNRAAIKPAEAMFIKLICDENTSDTSVKSVKKSTNEKEDKSN